MLRMQPLPRRTCVHAGKVQELELRSRHRVARQPSCRASWIAPDAGGCPPRLPRQVGAQPAIQVLRRPRQRLTRKRPCSATTSAAYAPSYRTGRTDSRPVHRRRRYAAKAPWARHGGRGRRLAGHRGAPWEPAASLTDGSHATEPRWRGSGSGLSVEGPARRSCHLLVQGRRRHGPGSPASRRGTGPTRGDARP
jgi:hypothetical protein